MTSVLYPVAYDAQGNEAWARDAVRGRYRCIECGGDMVLRYGDVVQRHFAHIETSDRPCSPESVEHRLAKTRVELAITAWASGGEVIWVHKRCECGEINVFALSNLPTSDGCCLEPSDVTAKQEQNVGVYVGDVVLFERDRVRCVVEIRKSHAVDDSKAAWLHASGLMWFELEAAAVLEQPNNWVAIAGSAIDCGKCEANIQTKRQRALQPKWAGPMFGYRRRMQNTLLEFCRRTDKLVSEFNRRAASDSMDQTLLQANLLLKNNTALLADYREVILSIRACADGTARSAPILEPMESERATEARDRFLASLDPVLVDLWVRYVEREEPGSSSIQNAYREAARRIVQGDARKLIRMTAVERLSYLKMLDAQHAELGSWARRVKQ